MMIFKIVLDMIWIILSCIIGIINLRGKAIAKRDYFIMLTWLLMAQMNILINDLR